MHRRWWMRLMAIGLVVAAALLVRPGLSAAADALLDAKRRAAAQLLHDGKPAEAIALLEEVTKATDNVYGDHLMMARASDKLGQTSDALRHYRRVIELTSSPRDNDERTARTEADKKLKSLDPLGVKFEDTVEEFYRKLDGLEREAIGARSMMALERVFRLRAALWQAQRLRDFGFCEVSAKGEWQDGGIDLRAGQSYRIRAAGVWHVKGKGEALIECTAAGTNEREPDSNGRMGQLLAKADARNIPIGEDGVIKATSNGRLFFIENDEGQPARVKNAGSVFVLISPAR